MNQDSTCDVLIIGGGPAGTTAAALLSARGWKVTLLEAGQHPRFHIGESLLPMNLPILEQLGILDEVAAMATFKPGADFTSTGEHAEPLNFPFERALRDSPPHAYQVRRSEFDQLLFENSRKSGATLLDNHKVTHVELLENGASRVAVELPDGTEAHWRCKYLLDASGQQTVVASQNKWRVRNKDHASAALFGHFDNVVKCSGEQEGNISIYWVDAGWVWMIPLANGQMSVGAVCRPDYLKQRSGNQEEFLLATINQSAKAKARMANARIDGDTRVAANYSYSSVQQTGPGFALIGDAYAFIDPVFSSGVYLAMSSATSIVPVAEAWLKNQPLKYKYATWQYERKMAKGLSVFSWFIYNFNTPAMTLLFENPGNVFKIEQAVTTMLAGDVYRGGMVQVRLWAFRLLFALASRFGDKMFPEKPTS